MSIRSLETSRAVVTETQALVCDGPCGTQVPQPEDKKPGPILPAGWALLAEGERLLRVCVACQQHSVSDLLAGRAAAKVPPIRQP